MKCLLISDTHRGFTQNTSIIHRKWARKVLSSLEYDILILAGDLATSKKDQLRISLRFFREVAGRRPIILARGNHDFWDKDMLNLVALDKLHNKWMIESDIVNLDSGSLVTFIVEGTETSFLGWDGWYSLPPNSNDSLHMPREVLNETTGIYIPTDEWMRRRADEAFFSALTNAETHKARGGKVVAVTHFPIVPYLTPEEWSGNPRYFQLLAPHVDVLCFGHSHKRVDGLVIDGVRLYNCGSDYDKPNYVLFEI